MRFDESGIKGEITAYSYMVKRGKPAAMMPIQERYAADAVTFIHETFGLETYVENLAENWKTLWIYKYEHVLKIIEVLPQAPETVLDHWILGKLFGYEESAIEEFICREEM